MTFTLRDYQTACGDALDAAFDRGRRRPLVVMATGLGKTVVFAHEAKKHAERSGKRVMVVAHRQELIFQAAQKLKAVTGRMPDIEMAEERADRYSLHREPFVVASVQTLRGARLERFAPDEFGLLIIDEAHHAVAGGYRKVIDHFATNAELMVLGVTATPKRLDKVMMKSVFDSAPFIMGIRDAVKQGWLVPVRQKVVRVESLDLSWLEKRGADFKQSQLAEEVERDDNVVKFAAGIRDVAPDKRTLVFCATVSQAERVAELLEGFGLAASFVTGKTPRDDRRELFERFSQGTITHLVNVGVATEGFDEPAVECVVMCRPTLSETVYTQCLGRGTRPLPGVVDGPPTAEQRRAAIAASDKPEVVVLDFVGVSSKHRLVTAVDVLAGEKTPEDVKQRVKEIQESERGTGDADADIEQAKAELEREKRERVREVKKAHVLSRTTTSEVDPFTSLAIKRPPASAPGHRQEATEPQRNTLVKFGLQENEVAGMSKADATRMIKTLIGRREKGYATVKQQRALQKLGHPKWKSASFDEASAVISEAKRVGWGTLAKRYKNATGKQMEINA